MPLNKINTNFGTAYLDHNGYYRLSDGRMLHRLIWEEGYNKPVPAGYFIHHLNHQKDDNRIQNLQCVKSTLHRRYHSSNPTEETRRKLSETKKGANNPNFGKPPSEKQRQTLLKYAKTPKSEEHKSNLSKARNTTGFVNVSKNYNKKYKQGFCWRYNYTEKGKRYDIRRINLEELEREVKRRNLKWERISDDDVV